MATVKLADIAQKLGLSISTVSRALNPTAAHIISEPVRVRIQTAAAKMGYVANHTAQQLVLGRSYTFGVALATAFNSLFFSDHLPKVLEGIYSVLQKEKRYGCKLVVLPREKPMSEMDRYILSSQIDGLLLSTQCDFSAPELYHLAEHLQARSRRPVVALNLPFKKGSRISVVSYDNRKAARLGVTHLIRRGCRRIGLIYADNNSEDMRERIEGFKETLAAHHLPLLNDLIVCSDFSVRGGRHAAAGILRKNKRCDALFCLNDEMAIGALSAVAEASRRCPEDVAVLGFDGLTAGEFTRPRLSTVVQPAAEMASVATQLLIDWIEGKRHVARSTLLEAKLLLRESA